jgi:hypothetical protein
MPGFASGSVYVGFVMDKVVMGQVFLRVLRLSPANIIPPCPSVLIPISLGVWTIGPLIVAVQRHRFTPSTWTRSGLLRQDGLKTFFFHFCHISLAGSSSKDPVMSSFHHKAGMNLTGWALALTYIFRNVHLERVFGDSKWKISILKLNLSHDTPWRRLGEEEV